ncbi:unnamed protein product [Closterium sp. NIES-54]
MNYGSQGEGGRDLQLGSMRAHIGSTAHKAALKAESDAEAAKVRQVTLTQWQATDSSTRHLIQCLHIAHFVCKKDAPMALFVPLRWFLAKEGLPDLPPNGGYESYYTEYGFKQHLSAIFTHLLERQLQHIQASPCLGISIDERTDRVHGKHMILYATFFKETAVITEFVTLLSVERTDVVSLTSVLLLYLRQVGIDLQKIVAIATDGASIMVGS